MKQVTDEYKQCWLNSDLDSISRGLECAIEANEYLIARYLVDLAKEHSRFNNNYINEAIIRKEVTEAETLLNSLGY